MFNNINLDMKVDKRPHKPTEKLGECQKLDADR